MSNHIPCPEESNVSKDRMRNDAKPRPIEEIGAKLGLTPEDLILYGNYQAKVKPKQRT